ncbi:MAG: nucleotidyltransferase family protein [Clostridium sp.]|nr:nucleotidyltransferase family protein [Clostridium sp.]MCM1209078.1 nucleotidyltransferase family protein [Ruminococcus sp.]
MKTVAIIAEYNPFHNGHSYQLSEIRERLNPDYIIALMGGNFLQRGHAAMWDKYERAKIACENGIDAVLELPFPYATGSAHDFAMGAVSILNKLGCIDYLAFGAETFDITLLSHIADILGNEPVEFKALFKKLLSEGISYPAARQKALAQYLMDDTITKVMSLPNNILAIEYLRALKTTNSKITPVLIKRTCDNYHDETITGEISSATAIRRLIKQSDFNYDMYDKLSGDVSEVTLATLKKLHNVAAPVFTYDLAPFIQQCLLLETSNDNICDLTKEMLNKLIKLDPASSYDEIICFLKSKEITASRISRVLVHILLNYTENDRDTFASEEYGYYANLLAFREASSEILKCMATAGEIPIITKKADFYSKLLKHPHINSIAAKRMWELDTKATRLYNCMVFNRYGTRLPNDFNVNLPIV